MKEILEWFKPGTRVKRYIGLQILSIAVLIFCIISLTNILDLNKMTLIAYIFLITLSIFGIIFSFILAQKNILYVSLKNIGKKNKSIRVKKLLYSDPRLRKGARVVVIGGGSGLPILLKGLKDYTSNITAIVNVSDDDASLTTAMNDVEKLTPGDIRKCLAALSTNENDMDKLLTYILEGKKWSDIGVNMLYGSINIDSTDPVTSSPGATYYGLLLSIMCGGTVTDTNIEENLPKLKEFYEKSGYMNNTPADLFERYLKTGVGGEPMIVDYEKSIIEFANSNPDGWEQVKDDIRILYPTPTIWNSHCIATFSEAGNEYMKAFDDKEIGQIAWSKYGFRTGITGGNYDVSSLGITGVPQTITSTVTSLKMSYYEKLINYLGNK